MLLLLSVENEQKDAFCEEFNKGSSWICTLGEKDYEVAKSWKG